MISVDEPIVSQQNEYTDLFKYDAHIVLVDTHEIVKHPPRTIQPTCEVALNIKCIANCRPSLAEEYPGTTILLDNGMSLFVAQQVEEMQTRIKNPIKIKIPFNYFIDIEHWENTPVDRVWVNGGEYSIFKNKSEFYSIYKGSWWKR